MKQKYEDQQRDNIQPIRHTTHHSNAGIKAVLIDDEAVDDYRNCSMRKLKQSQDFQKFLNGSRLSLDVNSNNTNESNNETSSCDSNRLGIKSAKSSGNALNLNSKMISKEQKRKENQNKSAINPFSNTKDTSHGSNGNNLILNTIQNSPFKTGGKSPNRVPIAATLSSNFFLKEKSNILQGPCIKDKPLITENKAFENKIVINMQPLVSPSESNRRYSSFLNKHLNFDFVTFEFIKSFTNLALKDLVKEEIIYSAEICNVFRGKYLSLPVAIKMYNIAKLREEDLVSFINYRNILYPK